MVEATSVVQYMDIKSGRVREESIERCFGENISLVKLEQPYGGPTAVEYFKFGDEAVKITDWRGWTDITHIQQEQFVPTAIILVTEHGKRLICSCHQEIPVYDPSKKIIGFHGETMYEHVVKKAMDIVPGETLRVRHCQNEKGEDIHFDPIMSIEPYVPTTKFYGIATKSGFCNCDDIYIVAGDAV
jgi:hypothetical protein